MLPEAASQTLECLAVARRTESLACASLRLVRRRKSESPRGQAEVPSLDPVPPALFHTPPWPTPTWIRPVPVRSGSAAPGWWWKRPKRISSVQRPETGVPRSTAACAEATLARFCCHRELGIAYFDANLIFQLLQSHLRLPIFQFRTDLRRLRHPVANGNGQRSSRRLCRARSNRPTGSASCYSPPDHRCGKEAQRGRIEAGFRKCRQSRVDKCGSATFPPMPVPP